MTFQFKAREKRRYYNVDMESQAQKDSAESADPVGGDALTEQLVRMDGLSEDVKTEVGQLMADRKLVELDMKGIKADELV